MSKYIDADLLRKEIEEERKNIEGLFIEGDNNFYDGQDDAYNHTLALIDSLMQEQPSLPDLDEAAEDFVWEIMENDEDGISDLCRKLNHLSKISDFYDGLAEFFKAGAEWQKQQMMKEAVEGEIQMRYSGCLCAKTIRAINEDKFKFGDKVRIIIVKEEKE